MSSFLLSPPRTNRSALLSRVSSCFLARCCRVFLLTAQRRMKQHLRVWKGKRQLWPKGWEGFIWLPPAHTSYVNSLAEHWKITLITLTMFCFDQSTLSFYLFHRFYSGNRVSMSFLDDFKYIFNIFVSLQWTYDIHGHAAK